MSHPNRTARFVDVESLIPEGRKADWSKIYAKLLDDPASGHMVSAALGALRLGFDPTEPDILRRIVNAGHAEYARHLAWAESPEGQAAKAKPETGMHEPVVYYMKMRDLVKIGYTTNIGMRASDVGAEAVLAVEFGGREVEGERHRMFAEHRSHGEWFMRGLELDTHIAAVRDAFMWDAGVTTEEWLSRYVVGRVSRDLKRGTAA